MKNMPLGDVIAERELEFIASDGSMHSVLVRIGKPVLSPETPWFCPYVIEGLAFRRQWRVAGEDSMQALMLAQRTIAVELEVLARDHNGSFTAGLE